MKKTVVSLPHLKDRVEQLTGRQREILQQVLAGFDHKSIARCLAIESSTVKAHLKKILHHFKVSNRYQLLALFVDSSLVNSDRGMDEY